MYVDFWKTLKVVLLLIAGAAVGIYGLLTYQNFKAPKQTVTVTGTGEIDATTDQATISIQITNNKDAQNLKTALIALGIPESRITQSNYGGGPIYQGGVNSPNMMMYPRPTTSGISFTVILDSLKNIEKVFAVINSNPNTTITSTYYSLNNRKSWEAKAKETALKDARTQVESVAKINHLTVGKLVSLTDTNSGPPIIRPMMLKGEEPTANGALQPDSSTTSTQSETVNSYSEQTVKINATYYAQYELY